MERQSQMGAAPPAGRSLHNDAQWGFWIRWDHYWQSPSWCSVTVKLADGLTFSVLVAKSQNISFSVSLICFMKAQRKTTTWERFLSWNKSNSKKEFNHGSARATWSDIILSLLRLNISPQTFYSSSSQRLTPSTVGRLLFIMRSLSLPSLAMRLLSLLLQLWDAQSRWFERMGAAVKAGYSIYSI